MKKPLLTLLFAAVTTLTMAQTATDFTSDDCGGTSHTLFTELDAGKVIVLVWVMPCGVCTGPALTTYNVVESYQSANPNTVYMYLCDDYGNTACSSVNSWGITAGIPDSSLSPRFSDAAIDMSDYGTAGMPKIVVVGGTDHTVFYNVNSAVNSTNLQNAINSALSTTGINAQNSTVSSLSLFPNPAANSAEIKFTLAKSSDVSIELFNLEGQLIKNVFSGKLAPGGNKMLLDVAGYSSGMYLVKLSDGDKSKFINLVVSH